MADEQEQSVEKEASELGWVPREQFKGNPDRWIPAEEFLERGRHILPIVNENNERLRKELTSTKTEMARMAELLKASQESIEALNEHHQAEVKRRVEQTRMELMEQIKEARQEGDIEQEIELNAKLADLRNPPKSTVKDPPEAPAKPVIPEVFTQWQAENKWFGTDTRRTRLAMTISAELRDKQDQRVGREFLDAVTAEVDDILGPARDSSKVEGSRGGERGNTGSGKSFQDLPTEAKEACDGFAGRLVGPGRAYKTLADWRAKYASDYFAEV